MARVIVIDQGNGTQSGSGAEAIDARKGKESAFFSDLQGQQLIAR